MKTLMLFFTFLLLFLLLFLPKGWLFVKYTNLLSTQKEYYLEWEKLHEHFFSVEAQNLTLYNQDRPIARIERIRLYPMLIRQSFYIEKLHFIKPPGNRFAACEVSQTLFDPLHPTFSCLDQSGTIRGNIDWEKGDITIKNNKGKNDVFHFGS